MNNDTIEERKKKMAKRKRVYFFLGWPFFIIGIGLFFYKPAFILAWVFIINGLVMRLLYYYSNIEFKALVRYEKLFNKPKAVIFTSFIIFSFFSSLCAQLEDGDQVPELNELEWIIGSPVKITDKKEKQKIYVIEFWAPWDQASLLSLPLLSKIHEEYGDDQISIIAITKEKKDRLTKYLNSIEKKIEFRVAVDDKGAVTKQFIGKGAGIPKVFVIGKNGEVLYSGNPIALESVIKKILKGTFDADVQKEINLLQLQLQNKMQMNKTLEAIRITDRIIELDPSDSLALRVRLFIFERADKLDEAVTFIEGLIARFSDVPELYFIKLDLMERVGTPVEDRREICEQIFEKFQDEHEILERLAWTAVSRMRFGTAPLSIALKASEKAVSALIENKKQNPAKLANYLETQARLYYYIGRIPKAIEEQEKVIRLRKGDPSEKEAAVVLDYYKEALELGRAR